MVFEAYDTISVGYSPSMRLWRSRPNRYRDHLTRHFFVFYPKHIFFILCAFFFLFSSFFLLLPQHCVGLLSGVLSSSRWGGSSYRKSMITSIAMNARTNRHNNWTYIINSPFINIIWHIIVEESTITSYSSFHLYLPPITTYTASMPISSLFFANLFFSGSSSNTRDARSWLHLSILLGRIK